MNILGIESSCDETAAAVVRDGREILSSAVSSQRDEHRLYGGVVPELASRRHVESVSGVVRAALEESGLSLREVDAVAVTAAPGLIGALLVGVSFAKGLAMASGKPLVPVHHLRGHVAANYAVFPDLRPPFPALIASGGHSHIVIVRDYCVYELIGRTTDDAAGEAFDKAARTVGLMYPGGARLDRISRRGDPTVYSLPTPQTENEFDFSFSGLKTAVLDLARRAERKGTALVPEDLAAAFCDRVSGILWSKTEAAAKRYGFETVVLAGGVSANSWLRAKAEERTAALGWRCYIPPPALTGDNAVMIASQGYYEYRDGRTAGLSLNGAPCMDITESFPGTRGSREKGEGFS